MSIVIPLTSLTDDQLQIIQKLLLIKPKPSFKQFKKNNYYTKPNPKSEPICLYYIDVVKKTISLPYAFCRTLLRLPIPSYHPSIPFIFTKKLYEQQVQIAEDALNDLHKLGSATLNLATAFGKTVIACYLSALLGKLTLVLLTSVTLVDQWYKSYLEFTDAKVWAVGSKQGPPTDGINVILCMDTRFEQLPQEVLQYIGTVIYDEAHTFCTPGRVKCILGVQPQYIISATATLNREDGLHSIIEYTCGLHRIIKISRKPFLVYKYNTGIEIEIEQTKQGTPDWNKMTLAQAKSEKRNGLIEQLIICNMNLKILILTWRSGEHAVPLSNMLKNKGYNVDYMAGTKRSYHDSHILVGTIKKIGTGFDEKAACEDFNGVRINLLLLVGSTQSVELLEQIAGRVFRSDFPQIIHFVDDCPISFNHWKKSAPWYRSRNGQIYEINSPYVDADRIVEGELKGRRRKNPDMQTDDVSDEQLRRFQEEPPK